jgi:hypothetical protein
MATNDSGGAYNDASHLLTHIVFEIRDPKNPRLLTLLGRLALIRS